MIVFFASLINWIAVVAKVRFKLIHPVTVKMDVQNVNCQNQTLMHLSWQSSY